MQHRISRSIFYIRSPSAFVFARGPTTFLAHLQPGPESAPSFITFQRISQLDDPPLFRNARKEKCRRRCSRH
jgi:hypothetical protein